MSRALHQPMLENGTAAGITMNGPRVSVAAGHLSLLQRGRGGGVHRIPDDLLAIARMHGSVAVSVEHDDGHRCRGSVARRASTRRAPHGGERRLHVLCTADG